MPQVYLDHVATTPLDPRVLEAMLPYLKENFGNPQSLHSVGQEARKGLDEARKSVAGLIGAGDKEIIFAASGSEANNFAVKGLALANQSKGKHIVLSAIEHFSILHSARYLEKFGFKTTIVPVDKYGVVDPDDVRRAISDETILVSIMLANAEIGTIEPIPEISKIVKERGIIFHTDAVAAVGNIPVNVKELGVDALSLAANQFYGPKGAAALYLKKGVRILPYIDGGTQEEGKRAGTEDVSAMVGLGKAAELAGAEMESRAKYLQPLRDKLIKGLPEKIPRIYLTGHPNLRLPHHVSVCIEFIEGESMLLFLDMEGISGASGSACTSRALKASHVLLAIGIDDALSHGSLVFSLGTGNTGDDIDYLLEKLPPIVERLRAMSPLYKRGV